jgi:hypothetical protein
MADHLTENQVFPPGVVVELHYLPCIEFFACLRQFEEVHLETRELYVKQTYRNRCHVLTANKVDRLTVPVQHSGTKQLVSEVRIDYSQGWVRRHWGCLQSAYGKSPFFEYYADELQAVFARKPEYLYELNHALLSLCLKYLGIKKNLVYTLSYQSHVKKTLFDARSLINDKKGEDNSIFYKKVPYYQTFGNDFVPNLSIIDLLFNKGPEARQILAQSTVPAYKAQLNKA